jgi:hypothetical protein
VCNGAGWGYLSTALCEVNVLLCGVPVPDNSIVESIRLKVREQIEKTEHLIQLIPPDRIEWNPQWPCGSFDIGHDPPTRKSRTLDQSQVPAFYVPEDFKCSGRHRRPLSLARKRRYWPVMKVH